MFKTVRLITVACLAATVLSAPRAPRAAESDAGASNGAKPLYRLPAVEDDALRYEASMVVRQDLGTRYDAAVMTVCFLLWKKDEKTISGKVVRFRLPEFLKREGQPLARLEVRKDFPQPKKLDGGVFTTQFHPRGAKDFTEKISKGAPKELEIPAEFICNDILPLVFVELPANFEAKPGFAWGKEDPTSRPGYSSHPNCMAWKISEVLTPVKTRSIAVLEASSSSVSRREDHPRVRRLRQTVHYDVVAGRVRSAQSSYRRAARIDPKTGMAVEFTYRDISVYEVLGPKPLNFEEEP